MMDLRWHSETSRVVAFSGDQPVGAIFPGTWRTRWRAWVTVNMNPVEGTAKTPVEAKAEVQKRFDAFLAKAKLRPEDAS